MENNNIEELNQNIEEVTEVTVEETVNEVEESTNETEETTEEVTEEVTESVVIVPNIEDGVENEETTEESINEVNETVEQNEVIGKISGFEKLYVRKEANKDSEPVGIVTTKDDLSIDIAHSTDDFYKVITSNGLEGYCVKEFVKID